jgi:hypothetical protein
MKSQDLKKLVEKYSYDQIDACIQQQLAKGENECNLVDSTNEVIEVLSKASVVREMMDHGMNFSDALRELGRKIRAVYGSEQEGKSN